jgi:DNA-binding winged helix-turn-helix (wHTH) protein
MCEPGPPCSGDFKLGPWTVQPRLRRIVRGNQIERLEPRCIDLLVFFARYPRQVHSRERLIEEVWQVRAVAENTLTHAVAELRRALGDDARNPKYIETIYRCGYRLLVKPDLVSHRQQLEPTTEPRHHPMIRGIDTAENGDLLIAMAPANEPAPQPDHDGSQPTEVVVRICIEMPDGVQAKRRGDDPPEIPWQQKIS